MRPLSLRARLVFGAVSLVAVGLVISNVAGAALFRTAQLQQVDVQLRAAFDTYPPDQVQTALAQVCARRSQSPPVQFPTDFIIVVYDDGGEITCRPPAASGKTDRAFLLGPGPLAAAAANRTLINLPEKGPPMWRAGVVQLSGGYAVIARSLEDVHGATGRLGLNGLSVGALVLAVAAVAGVAVVRVGLLPLTRIQHTAERIADGDLTQRVDVASACTEVGRLGASLNSMLGQIEDAFAERDRTEQRLRRFVADASHELRTPLATIRGHAELVRTGVAGSPEDITRVISRIESESVRMNSLVEDLLLLARLDTTRVLGRRPVDLLSIAVDAVTDTRARFLGRAITVRNPTVPPWRDAPPTVLGDEARLHQVVANLLNNAVQYSPSDAPIEVEVGILDREAVLAVVDHGPGLQAGNEERVFERFFREDAGRGRKQGGAGLGLAIAWSLADKHGGSLRYHPTPGGGSTFCVRLPVLDA